TSVHNGQDIAIPTGTEIRAPMAGTVLLADSDLYYEGGAVFLDLGRGLVSITMHMSRVDVETGDTVGQGQLLGLSGATGRVTGPHLHWAIKARNELTPSDREADLWLDPVLMLELQPPIVPLPSRGQAMAEPVTRATQASVKDFIAAVPNETRRKDAEALLRLFGKVTGAKAKMWGPTIIGFGSIAYTYETGHSGT